MALLTIVAIIFSGLLLWLITSASTDRAIITMLVFLAAICYATLELFVNSKHYYNAGVDNILMCMVLVFIISAFFFFDNDSWLIISSCTMVISLWLSMRFTDAFMAMVSYCSFIVFIFFVYIKIGEIAKATAPFMIMTVSAFIYFTTKKLNSEKKFIYRFCLEAVTVLTLITFYAAGNYFVVKELGNQMFQLTPNAPMPLGWLFWIFTLVIPSAYIIYGIIKKDFMAMRTGLGLIAATIFTVKYYYTILPAEIEMLIGGLILIAVSYALIKYLSTPKYGYTSGNTFPNKKEIITIEALVVSETFDIKPAVEGNNLYGGGSGGGGGATGEY
jgi:hypothetical protein